MVLCHPVCLEYLPPAWQNLLHVDNEIIDDLSKDSSARAHFWKTLDSMSTAYLKNFSQMHPHLCRMAIVTLPDAERPAYEETITRIKRFIFAQSGSNVFWRGFDRTLLPSRWQQPIQQQRLLEDARQNQQHFDRLMKGVLERSYLFTLDYPELALKMMEIAIHKWPTDTRVASVHARVLQLSNQLMKKAAT